MRVLLAVLLVGIAGCGDEEQVALENLRSLGVRVENGFDGKRVLFNHSPNASKISDDDLLPLLKLSRVESVSVAHTSITDEGLSHLGGLTNLKSLTLSYTAITDAGLVHIKGLAKLRDLTLPKRITDAGITDLQNSLPNCKIEKAKAIVLP